MIKLGVFILPSKKLKKKIISKKKRYKKKIWKSKVFKSPTSLYVVCNLYFTKITKHNSKR